MQQKDGDSVTYLGTLHEFLLASLHILVLAAPSPQHRGLESTPVAEGEGPGLLGHHTLVDGVQVHGGLLLRLAAGEEGDAGHGSRHGAGQSHDGCLYRHSPLVTVLAVCTSLYVWLLLR